MSAEDKARGKSVILNSSENGKSRPPTNGQPGEDCGANMYVNNLEYIDLETPARHGHVNLEYIDASCFSSPALTHSFLGCDDEVSISSVLRELSSPEISQFEKQEDKDELDGGELSEGDLKSNPVKIEGEVHGMVEGGQDDKVSISSVLFDASLIQRKESKEAKRSSGEDAKMFKTESPDNISTTGVKFREKSSDSTLEDKKIATIENLNKWGFLR